MRIGIREREIERKSMSLWIFLLAASFAVLTQFVCFISLSFYVSLWPHKCHYSVGWSWWWLNDHKHRDQSVTFNSSWQCAGWEVARYSKPVVSLKFLISIQHSIWFFVIPQGKRIAMFMFFRNRHVNPFCHIILFIISCHILNIGRLWQLALILDGEIFYQDHFENFEHFRQLFWFLCGKYDTNGFIDSRQDGHD